MSGDILTCPNGGRGARNDAAQHLKLCGKSAHNEELAKLSTVSAQEHPPLGGARDLEKVNRDRANEQGHTSLFLKGS